MKKIPHMELILAPLAVLAFAGILSLMYGWVGDMKPPGLDFKENTPLTVIAGTPQANLGQPAQSQPIQAQPRPYAGMRVAVPDPTAAQTFGLTPGSGVVITEVMPGSPAQAAGLLPGDILLKCDRQPVDSPAGLSTILSGHQPGDGVKCLMLTGNGRKKTLYIKLGQTSPMQKAAAAVAPSAQTGIVGVLSGGNSLYDLVSDATHARYVMLMDPANNRYAGMAIPAGNGAGQIPDLLSGFHAGAVIASGLDANTLGQLQGITAYTGVSGSVIDAFQLYRAGRLRPAG